MLKSSLYILIFCTATCYLHAQDFWQPSNGPWGGNITALATASDGSMLAGTYSRGMYRSTNQGEHWETADPALSDSRITAIASASTGLVLASTFTKNIYRSIDGGITWNEVSSVDGVISRVVVTPDNDTYAIVENSNQGAAHGVFRSTDMGKSWHQTDTTAQYARTLAATANGIFAANTGFFYRSTDNGNTWQIIESGISRITQLTSDNRDNLYALATDQEANNGMFLSTDNGDSWRKIDSVPDPFTRVIAIAPDGTPVNISRDSISWQYPQEQRWQRTEFPSSNVVDPGTPVVFTGNDEIYIGTRTGLVRSLNRGVSWERVNVGIAAIEIFHLAVNVGGSVFTGSEAGIMRSTDTTNHWTMMSTSSGKHAVVVLPNGTLQGIVFARDDGGVLRSTDNGEQWEYHVVSRGELHAFPLAAGSRGNLYTNQYGSIIYRSLDSGKTWEGTGSAPQKVREMMGIRPNEVRITALSVAPSGKVFAAAEGLIFQSTDQGEHWDTTTSQRTSTATVLWTDDDNDILIGTSNQLYRLWNNGNNWNLDTLGLSMHIQSIIRSVNGVIYVGGNQGAFHSPDDGKTWEDISSGLRIRSVTSLAIHPDGHLLAGLAGGSVVRSTERVDAPASVETHDDRTTPSALSSAWATSDPYSDLITIHFSLMQPEHITVDIFNSDGQHITQLLNTDVTSSTMQQVVWNTENVSSGRYFCQITYAQQSTVLPVTVIR